MPRKPRNQPQAEYQHITNQGARHGDIYFDDDDRTFFTELLDHAHEKFGVMFHASCLMGNHYHLLAQFPERNMSQVMHWIGMRHSQHINHRYDYTGRLCKGRFFNRPVDNDEYFVTAARYIHRNPIDLGVAPSELGFYNSSSYGAYLGIRDVPQWLRTDVVLALHGDDRADLRDFTEQWMSAYDNPGGTLAA